MDNISVYYIVLEREESLPFIQREREESLG